MPAPPPPPPMAPAAPPPPLMKMSKSSADERGALLKSIRQGKKLKKAVTNDRSAPLVTGTPSSRPTPKTVNNNQMSRTTVSPMRELTLQEELKKQLANDNRNRGPPPPTPNRNLPGSNYQKQLFSPRENVASYQKQSFSQREHVANGLNLSQLALNVNNLQINPSTLHRKAKSNVNLNTMEISDNNSKTNGFQPSKPVINHGKPNLAPKPPVLNGKPLLNPKTANRPSLNRAQSMKSAPRTPSPQSPVEATNAAIKFGTVRHMSSIIGQSLAANSGSQPLVNSAQHSRSRPALNGRPSAPPPSIPLPQSPFLPPSPSQPPPPPSKTNLVKHPNHAPPPPPPLASLPQAPPHAPPPPPHKTQISRQPPAIPSPVGSNSPINPPPPPPRNSSMREGGGPSNVCVDLEEKFKHLFQSPDRFPLPPPYRNVIKVYNSKPNMQKPGVV